MFSLLDWPISLTTDILFSVVSRPELSNRRFELGLLVIEDSGVVESDNDLSRGHMSGEGVESESLDSDEGIVMLGRT